MNIARTKFAWLIVLITITGTMLLGFTPRANATPLNAKIFITTSDGGSVVISDGGVGDLSPLLGSITYAGPVSPNFQLTVDSLLSKPIAPNTATEASLDLSFLAVSSGGGGWIEIDAFDDGYLGLLGNLSSLASIGGTLNPTLGSSATIHATAWVNPDNLAFTPGVIPPGSLQIFDFTSGSLAFAGTGALDSLATGSLSQYFKVVLEFTGTGSITGDGNQTSTLSAAAVPEPASIGLLGIGLIFFARKIIRKKKPEMEVTA